MKTLLLMRHAKSSWDHGALDDHDRPLNARGRDSADRMGQWLTDQDLVPDFAWVSSAARTQETWARLSHGFDPKPQMRSDRQLYLSGPDRMLNVFQHTPDAATTVILIAHQPGMSAITGYLADPQGDTGYTKALNHFPTGAIVVMQADIKRWSDLAPEQGQFTAFAQPKGLKGQG